MPQGPIAVQVVPYPALKSELNLDAESVVKSSPGTVLRVNVITAGSDPGSVNDSKTEGEADASNLIFAIPNEVGSYDVNFPALVGILVVPGTGQVVALSYQ